MKNTGSGAKGLKTEELIRAYFLRGGFFVMRGIKLRCGGDDSTDIDLWVYERSATLARRRTIIDIKDKTRPQAAERLFFIKGLANVIAVEGAGVATSDSRAPLRELGRRHGLIWIDGDDLRRLKESESLQNLDRITEEELASEIASIDSARSGRIFREKLDEVRFSIADRFGPSCANTALEGFRLFAAGAVGAHPSSPAARMAGRLAYLTAAISAAALDFASADHALRPSADRVRHMTDAIRFGANSEGVLSNLRWAETAIREYAPNGAGVAQIVHEKFWSEFNAVPAEALAEIIVKQSNSEKLFTIAKALEQAAYSRRLVSFDYLDAEPKGFLAALLDFVDVSRPKFADAWHGQSAAEASSGSYAEVRNETIRAASGNSHSSSKRKLPSRLRAQRSLI